MTDPNPAPFPPHDPASPQYAGSGAAPKKSGRAPKVLIIIGGVILLLSVIAGTVIAVLGIDATTGGINELESFDSGSGTITAEAGDDLQLYVEQGTTPPSCVVEGPSADSVGEGTIQSSTIGGSDHTWVSFDSFTAHDAGEYSIDCEGTMVAVGPPLSIVGIFGAVGGVLLGVFGGFLGFVMIAIGVILLIVRKRRV